MYPFKSWTSDFVQLLALLARDHPHSRYRRLQTLQAALSPQCLEHLPSMHVVHVGMYLCPNHWSRCWYLAFALSDYPSWIGWTPGRLHLGLCLCCMRLGGSFLLSYCSLMYDLVDGWGSWGSVSFGEVWTFHFLRSWWRQRHWDHGRWEHWGDWVFGNFHEYHVSWCHFSCWILYSTTPQYPPRPRLYRSSCS